MLIFGQGGTVPPLTCTFKKKKNTQHDVGTLYVSVVVSSGCVIVEWDRNLIKGKIGEI